MGQQSTLFKASWKVSAFGFLLGAIALAVQAQPNGVIQFQERAAKLSTAELEAFEKLGTNDEFLTRRTVLSNIRTSKNITASEKLMTHGIDPAMQEGFRNYNQRDNFTWEKYQKNFQQHDSFKKNWSKLEQPKTNALGLKRDPSRERVVQDLVIARLAGQIQQRNVTGDFCKTPLDSNCSKGVAMFGATAEARITAKSPQCKKMQAAVSKIPTFNDGLADSIALDQLQTAADYYAACTTAMLPEKMRNVLGIIVDTDASLLEPATGIPIRNRRYAAIGMAVQLSANRIYTARHVLFSGERDGRRFTQPRAVKSLMYIPLAAPRNPISLLFEVGAPQDKIDNAEVPNDQAVLELATAFIPPRTKWPIVRRMAVLQGKAPTPLYIAGFHPGLARAAAAGKTKAELLTLSNWPNYIRRDSNVTCQRVTQNEEGCMLHSCDTLGGVSGAPIFVDSEAADDDRPVVIGLHSGEAFNAVDTVCSSGTQGIGLNLATLPNAASLQK